MTRTLYGTFPKTFYFWVYYLLFLAVMKVKQSIGEVDCSWGDGDVCSVTDLEIAGYYYEASYFGIIGAKWDPWMWKEFWEWAY